MAPGSVVVPIVGRMTPAEVEGLSERVTARLGGTDANQVVCDVGSVVNADAVTIDALARLQLNARRSGRTIWLLHASSELKALLHLMGLSDVVPCVGGSGLEPGRQPEEREPARGVKEEGDPGDPIA